MPKRPEKRRRSALTAAARGNTLAGGLGAPHGRYYLLAARGREPWREVNGRTVTRARWQCIAALDGEPAQEAITAAVPEWAHESSVIHSSALTAETIARYEREATEWQKRPI